MTFMKHHPLITFFVLAYALSWWPWLLYTVHLFPFPLLATGPALAALLMTEIIGGWAGTKALLLRLVQWRARPRWYAVVLLLPVVIWGAAVMLNVLLGAPAPAVAQLVGWPSLALGFLRYLVNPLQGPLGEEPGWRGFALPRLTDRFGVSLASIILGLVWACWHLPQFFIPEADTYQQSFFVYVLQVTALSVAMAWLYARTNGSLLLVMLLHAAVNNAKDIVPSALLGATNTFGVSASLVAWLTVALLWICAGYFLVTMRRQAEQQ